MSDERPDDRPDERAGERPRPAGLPILVVGRPDPVSTNGERVLAAGAPAISSDGRFVAFVSESGDLVPGDANGAADVFVRDTMLDRTVLISRSVTGGSAAGSSLQPAISADGRFVAFTSSAPDLVEGDSNGSLDVFVHDLRTGITQLISRGRHGELADADSYSPSLSADGRFVAYCSMAANLDTRDTNHVPDVYRYDRLTGHTTLISVAADGRSGDGPSGQPSISANGRLVAFTSAARFSEQDTNSEIDVYLHDADTGELDLVSRTPDGAAGNGPSLSPSLSADGSAVAFTSHADDLVDGDDNRASDVFVHRRESGRTELISTNRDGEPAEDGSHSPSISGDGRRVAFLSAADDLVPVPGDGAPSGAESAPRDHTYVRDLDGAGTALVSGTRRRTPGDGVSTATSISSWGRHVAFADTSTDLAGTPGGPPLAPQEQVYVAPVRTAQVPRPPATSSSPAQPSQPSQSSQSSPASSAEEDPDSD